MQICAIMHLRVMKFYSLQSNFVFITFTIIHKMAKLLLTKTDFLAQLLVNVDCQLLYILFVV